MSWPRAAQPTELAAWRRRREQDVAIRAFRRGRYSDTEFRAAAASAQLPADALEDEVLQRRELAAIVGWSLALKSKPSNTGLKWAGEAADANRRGTQHPKRLGSGVRAAPLCVCAARASVSTASSWDWTDQD